MMSNDGEIQLCEPAPFLYFENGEMAMTDGASVRLVIVTCEAIKATASRRKCRLDGSVVCRVLS